MDELQKLYDAVSSKFDVGSFEDFSNKMTDAESRKRFYDVVSAKGFDVGDYETYESRLSNSNTPNTSDVLKGVKAEASGDLESPSANSVDSSSASKSNIDFNYFAKPEPSENERKNIVDYTNSLNDSENIDNIDVTTAEKEEAATRLRKMYEKAGISNYSIDDKQITKEAARAKDVPRLQAAASELVKTINAKNPKEQRGYWSNLLDNVEIGSTELGVMISSVPETLYDIFALPQNGFSKLTGIDIEASSSKFKEDYDITNPILDHYIEENERVKEKVNEFNEKYESTSVYENIKAGNYGDAFELLGSSIAQSAPVSLGMMAGGAVTTTGRLAGYGTVAFTGSNRLQIEKENPELSELTKTIKSLGLAGAETVFASISQGSMGKVYKDILLKEGKEAGAVVFKEGLVKMYQTALKKYGVAAGALGEGIEEVATTITQNMINGKPAFENVEDSFIQGVGGGALYGAPVNINNLRIKFKDGFEKRSVNKIIESETNDYNSVKDAFMPDSQITADKIDLVQKPKAYEMLEKELEDMQKNQEIDETTAEEIKKDFLNTTLTVSKTTGVDLSREARVEAVSLIKEKEQLKAEIKDMDDALSSSKKERVKVIDEKLISLSNGGNTKNTEVEDKTPTTKNEENVPTNKEESKYFDNIAEAKKNDPETYWSVDAITPEDKGTVVEVEGGGGFVGENGDIKGIFKEPDFKGKGVADNILQEAVKQGGVMLDNFDNYLTPIYERNGFRVVSRTPFNEEYAPEGWNKEKHGTPDVVAMIHDPENKLDIEEQSFPDPEKGYDQMIAYRDSYLKDTQNKTGQENSPAETQSNETDKLVQATEENIHTLQEQKENKNTNKQISDKTKDLADKIRKIKVNSSVKDAMSKLNSRPTALFEFAWDSALETVATTVELTGNVAQAVHDGIENLRNSEWYKGLSKEGRIKAERMMREDLNRQLGKEEVNNTSFLDSMKASYNKVRETAVQKLVDKFYLLRKEVNSKFDIYDDSVNFSQAEKTMHGKAANDIDKFDKQMKDVVKDIVSRGLTVDQVSDYMYAKHAAERNAHIKENIDPENEFGSGMTPQEIDRILNKTFTSDQIKDLEEVSQVFANIIQETRDIMLDGGLITQEQYNSFVDYYENYVPLKGFENEEITNVSSMVGSDINVSGNITKRAAGRSTRADNVISNIIAQRVDAALKVRKNEVLQTLYKLADENPDNGVMTLYTPKTLPKTRIVQSDGTQVNQPDSPYQRKDYVGVKVDGEQYYLKFANKELGRILNAANIEKTDVVTKTVGRFNRYLSATLTTLNPEFVISNFARDIQTAVFNVAAEADINAALKGQNIAKQTVRDTGKAIKAIYANERQGKVDSEFQKFYDEFKEDGAKTGWANQHSPDNIKKQLQNLQKLEESTGVNATTVKGKAKAIFEVVNDVNTAIENGVRLSAYVNARRAGLTRPQAAAMAKELTVNFNKSGEWGTVANSLYLFFNAAVQGNVRFIKAMGTLKKTVQPDGSVKKSLNRGQKIALSMVAFSSVVAMLNQAASEDDEDGQSFYSKIPDYEKERNLIFMNPLTGKDYFKIPLPYGYNIFHNMGTIATEVGTGERSVGDGIGFLTGAAIGAFSPISFGSSDNAATTAMRSVVPTVLKPIYDLSVNEDFFGSQIYNENFAFSEPVPDAVRGRKTTPDMFKNVSRFVNEITGGNDFESGAVDFSPESLYYMFKFAVGGTGTFLSNSAETVATGISAAQGEDVDVKSRKIPFVRKVYAEPNEYVDQENFYDRFDLVRQRANAIKDRIKKGDPKEDDRDMYSKVASMVKVYEETAKKLSEIRKKKKRYQEISDPIERTQKLRELDDMYFRVIKKANGRYNDKLGINYQ